MRIQFDDIIYNMQSFGGASVYWNEVTRRVSQMNNISVIRTKGSKYSRFCRVYADADIFHSSHFRRAVPRKKCFTVSTVHDMNYELGYLKKGFGNIINTRERRLSYFDADALICISRSTRRELLEVYPELEKKCPIYVVHHGCYTPMPLKKDLEKVSIFGPYVLFVGGRKGYKRFEDLLIGFKQSALYRERYKIICTGNEFEDEEQKFIKKLGMQNDVISVGNVTATQLAALYRNAYCLAYTSIHEGFGMPLIEAMRNFCPVIACNISCMPEITGDAAILIEPKNPNALCFALESIFDISKRKRLIRYGTQRSESFTWSQSANAHMEIYQSLTV